jgi:8-oxo-dGTP pyrophosphatase MutT (NUDIX family)
MLGTANLPSKIVPVCDVSGVVLVRNDGSALLQLRDQKHGLSDAGKWVFPGGHCDGDETVEDCARREFLEETEYQCGRLHYLADFILETDGRARHFTFFWQRFDGKQALRCLEGAALEFVARDKCPANTPDYLPGVWDLAISAAQSDPAGSFT